MKVWRLYPGVQLADVAIALLSLTASEAAVERSFSAQSLVHAKRRNAMHNDSVEAEMMVKFNSSIFCNDTAKLRVIEMEVEASEDSEDAATVVPEAPAADEQLLEAFGDVKPLADEEKYDAPAAAASSSSAAAAAAVDHDADDYDADDSDVDVGTGARQRALRRQPSIRFESMDRFLQWFIDEHALQPASRINANVTLALERHSIKLHESPGTATLLLKLRKALKQIAVS